MVWGMYIRMSLLCAVTFGFWIKEKSPYAWDSNKSNILLCQPQPSLSVGPFCCLLFLITPMCDQGRHASSSTSCQVILLHWSHDRMLAFVVGLRVLFHKAVDSDAVCLRVTYRMGVARRWWEVVS